MKPECSRQRSPDGPPAGGPGTAPPESIPLVIGTITFKSAGATYRTDRIEVLARRVPDEPPAPNLQELNIAAKVLELLTALDPKKRMRKAPPITVFNLYYRQQLSPAQIAEICGCDRTVIFDRLAAIRAKLPWSPQQLQELSPQIEAMEEALSDSRAREIHHKSAALGEEGEKG